MNIHSISRSQIMAHCITDVKKFYVIIKTKSLLQIVTLLNILLYSIPAIVVEIKACGCFRMLNWSQYKYVKELTNKIQCYSFLHS